MNQRLIIDKYKYIILSFILVLLFFALVTQFFSETTKRKGKGKGKEGFTTNDDKPENVLYGNITENLNQ